MKFLKFTFLIILFFAGSRTAFAQQSSEKQLLAAASNFYNEGKYDEAVELSSQVIKINFKSASAYLIRGISYDSKGEYDKAISDLDQAIILNPKFSEAWNARGTAYLGKKEFDKAISDLNEALRMSPKEANSLINRAFSYHSKKEYDKAIADLDEAIRIEPSISSAWMNRGDVHYSIGDYENAISDQAEAIRLDPLSGYAYINIIEALVRKLRFNEAKDYYNIYRSKKLISFVEKEAIFFQYFLTAVTENIPEGLFESALFNLDTAVQVYMQKDNNENLNEFIAVLALKGYVLEQLERNAEANDAYAQALVINGNQPNVKEALQRLAQKERIVKQSDKTPPFIQLISPQASRGLKIGSDSKTEIIGRAKDPAGIASVTVNGKPAKTEEDGLFILNVSLKEGANNLLITAVDKKGNTTNKTFILTGNALAKKEEAEIIIPVTADNKTPQYHAILIAANDYVDPAIPDLENPVKDATELKNILVNNYTFNEKNVETLYNKSREEIMQSVILKSNMLTENDNLLIFYAGHGIGEKDKFGDVDGYWIPSSAKKGLNPTYISSDDINKALKRSNAKHILVIADACFSGAFTRELPTDASVGVQKQYSVPSRKIMASGNMEPVPDNSRFVFYLKKNLKENKEKYLTSKKLFDSFYEAILNNSDTSPQYAAIKNVGDEGGEFVFIKK